MCVCVYCRRDALSDTINGHGQWKNGMSGLRIIERVKNNIIRHGMDCYYEVLIGDWMKGLVNEEGGGGDRGVGCCNFIDWPRGDFEYEYRRLRLRKSLIKIMIDGD